MASRPLSRLLLGYLFSLCLFHSSPSRNAWLVGASPIASRDANTKMVYNWAEITPSPNINWTPCFDKFTCTRLEVPLDYDDPSLGTTTIAFQRLAAETQPAENILINPGGPGGSGVLLLDVYGEQLAAAYGTQYNYIGFDPRGVNNSGPVIDCFPGDPETRNNFHTMYYRGVPDASSTSLANQYYRAQAYGHWCSDVVGGPNGNGSYVSTPLVARDMLSYIEAEKRAAGEPETEAKLWYYGFSYGTVLGATFASMFPDRVGRMVLDGVVDAEDYYNLQWKDNLLQADQVVESFFKFCHQAGPQNCSFYAESPEKIQERFDNLLEKIKETPVPVWDRALTQMPQLAMYEDLKVFLWKSLYAPYLSFPLLADVLAALERGDGTLLLIGAGVSLGYKKQDLSWSSEDAAAAIRCSDGYGKGNLSTLQAYKDYVEFLMDQSHYIGDAWSYLPLDCISLDCEPPASGRFSGPLPPSAKETSFPILFIGNTIDPVTPIRGAHKMSSGFPKSVVLEQNSVGHASMTAPSTCTVGHIKSYFDNGTLPSPSTVCQPDGEPFTIPGEGMGWFF